MKSIPMMPALSILIDGNDPGFDRGLHLIEMQIQQKLNFPAQCWLKLSLEETLAVPTCCRAGATVEIFVLENSNRNLLFKGRLTGRDLSFDASQGTILHLKAYDAFYQLRINSDVKSYEQTSVGDLFREHCAGLPLTTEAYADSATINQLYQTGQSHYDLLIERCSRAGLFIAPGPGILSLMDRSGIARQFVLERGGNLISFTISESALRSVANVQISGWLPSNNEAVTGESSSAFSSGSSFNAQSIDGEGSLQLTNHVFESKKEADDLTRSHLQSRHMSERSLSGVCIGAVALAPGVSAQVNAAPHCEGDEFVIANVRHSFTHDGGYLCHFDSIFPAPPVPDTTSSFTNGIVTRVDDPEGRGCVKVSFPSNKDLESPWLQVLLPAAGANKGLIALPSVGDSVVILQNSGDLNRAVVLGAVFGEDKAAQKGGVCGSAIGAFHFLTPGGHRLSLDDDKSAVSLIHSDGSELVFSNGSTKLTSQGDLTIEAPGSSIEIKAARINLKNG